MALRLPGVEDDDRDRAVGAALVIRICRIHLDQARPEGVALLLAGLPRAHTATLAADLDLGLRRGDQVAEPCRVLVEAALGGDHDEPVAVLEVKERRDARLAAAAPDVMQQQDRRAADVVAQPPAAEPVQPHVRGGHPVEERPEERGLRRRRHSAGTLWFRAGRMLDRIALRDTWRVVLATRALVWAVGIVAVLRFGLEPKITPPHEVILGGWTRQLLAAPAVPW